MAVKKVVGKPVKKLPRGYSEDDKCQYISTDEALQMTNQQHRKLSQKQMEVVKELEIRLVQAQIEVLQEKLNRMAHEKVAGQAKTRAAQKAVEDFNEDFEKLYEIDPLTHSWGWKPDTLELIVTAK